MSAPATSGREGDFKPAGPVPPTAEIVRRLRLCYGSDMLQGNQGVFVVGGRWVARRPVAIVVAWLVVLVALRWLAPSWNDVAHDGDLAHLPARMTSVAGERLIREAFPDAQARSQIVVVLSREDGPIEAEDVFVAYDAARRMKAILAASLQQQLPPPTDQSEDQSADANSDANERNDNSLLQQALQASNDAVYFDEELHAQLASRDGEYPRVLPDIYRRHADLLQRAGEFDEAKEFDEIAVELADDASAANPFQSAPVVDVWTWREPLVGKKLISENKTARLIVLQLTTELLATRNMEVLDQIEAQLAEVRRFAELRGVTGLRIDVSGSAAVGGDMLRASKAMVSNTELFSGLLVLLILAIVYRTPLLVAVPLLSIVVALAAATSVVALLTQVQQINGLGWFDIKVFTTTRIFVTVILFGAGTDYCLFLIARFKEEFAVDQNSQLAIERTLAGVGDALAASALTTVIGLATMAFSEFGKYRHSGPVIGFCLIVGLLVCVTLTPAILRLMGPAVFWPWGVASFNRREGSASWWRRSADWIIRSPGLILMVSVLLLAPAAVLGAARSNAVTYDFLQSLSPRAASRRGAEVMERHFPIGEGSPVTVLALRPEGGLTDDDALQPLTELTHSLYLKQGGGGVSNVRSIIDPLGDFPPGEAVSLLGERAWRMRLARPHRRTESIFLAQTDDYRGRLARFDLVLETHPFSLEAVEVLDRIEHRLDETSEDPQSYWNGARFYLTGAAAGVRDLREVTRRDNVRIEILVVLGVFIVLVVILRRPLICLYLILTVLLSYYATLGATVILFQWLYGDAYIGLDWRTPLFLFVILVAVGQDYNVYLATRVFEEQQRLGPLAGLRKGIAQTGGIITSCGVIMAGAFFSMTSTAWIEWFGHRAPWLQAFVSDHGAIRGLVELGFALSFGVMLDTMVVRSILAPAFLALLAKRDDSPPQLNSDEHAL